MIDRLDTNKLGNVANFFAHLLATDALPWHVLAYIRLTGGYHVVFKNFHKNTVP